MDAPNLVRLNEDERQILQPLLKRRGYAGIAGLFLAGMPVLVLGRLAAGGTDISSIIDAKLVIKIVGFLVLAFFAWRWSILAAVIMLGWHLALNTGYLESDLLVQKISYFVFAVWIALGIYPAVVRRALLLKAEGFAASDAEGQRRAERWLKIYQGRARRTGDLPPEEILEGSGMGADDPFWKQDNSAPSEGFAVNIDTTYNKVLAMGPGASEQLVGKDDDGNRVALVPIRSTGTSVKYDFANFSIPLEVFDDLTPGEFLQRQARALEDTLARGAPEGLEIGADPSVFDEPIRRLYWDADCGHWEVTFGGCA